MGRFGVTVIAIAACGTAQGLNDAERAKTDSAPSWGDRDEIEMLYFHPIDVSEPEFYENDVQEDKVQEEMFENPCQLGQERELRCTNTNNSLFGCMEHTECRYCGVGDEQVLCKADRVNALATLKLPTDPETKLTGGHREIVAGLTQENLGIFCEVPASHKVTWTADCVDGGDGCNFGGVWKQCQEDRTCEAGQEWEPRCKDKGNSHIGCIGHTGCRYCGGGDDQVLCKADRERVLAELDLPTDPLAPLTEAHLKIAAQLGNADRRILCEIPADRNVTWQESCVTDGGDGCSYGGVRKQCLLTTKATVKVP